MWRGSVVNDLIRKSGDIDVYVISGEDEPDTTRRPMTPRRATAAPQRLSRQRAGRRPGRPDREGDASHSCRFRTCRWSF